MPSILPTHFPSSPNPHPSHLHPISVPLPSHSPSASSSLFFRPHPIPLLYPTHSPSVPSPLSSLRYSPNLFICYPVSSRIQLVHSSPRQLINLPVTPRTCSSVTLSPLAYNLFTRLPINSSTCPLLTELVHLLPCLFSHTTCPPRHPINSSTCPLLPELVHLLPCLLSHTTCSLVYPSTRQLARYSPNLFTCYHVY